MVPAPFAILLDFQSRGRLLSIFHRRVVASLAVAACEGDDDAVFLLRHYSMTLVTTPAPTVRPPSRIAKRSPSSHAIGVISSTFIRTLSPGITISTPSGSEIEPVTSV